MNKDTFLRLLGQHRADKGRLVYLSGEARDRERWRLRGNEKILKKWAIHYGKNFEAFSHAQIW